MKKVITALSILSFITFTAFAAMETVKGNGHVTNENRTLSGYNKISAGGSADIIIDQNGTEGVTVETDDNLQSYIKLDVENGTLHVKMQNDVYLKPTKMIIHISCKSLSALNTGGSGDVSTKSKLTGDELQISNGGSGDYKINVDVKLLDINSGGSGDFTIRGIADSFEYSGAGSGDVTAKDLTAKTAKIVTSGSGDITLKKGTSAKVTSVGSGDVSYE